MGMFGKMLLIFSLTSALTFSEVGARDAKSCAVIIAEKKTHESLAPKTSPVYGDEWCTNQFKVWREGKRNCSSAEMVSKVSPHNSPVKYFLMLFITIGYGAVVRTILKTFGLPFPYTVVLMLSGLGFGFLSKNNCELLEGYTAIARSPPKVILFTFLPILIFESAFSIPVHTFIRSLSQILITAFPGMIISTFATAGIAMLFLREYEWDLKTASLFGSIISATDPVAVVAILRELGTSEMLTVNIEGESLLNDGVAILLYQVFERIMVCDINTEEFPVWKVMFEIGRMFFRIAIGGPLFGWVIAKITIFWLSRIFNDAGIEVTLTLASAYLTYFIGEQVLEVSGVMAVVSLGLTISWERTSISPEVESILHNFWEMLGYLANTVLFVFVGIIIAETAFTSADWTDLYYLGFLYVGLNIIRLIMLMVLYPLLARIGYGMRWENMIVMMWGGLRGAVGLCLTLEVYSGELCPSYVDIGPKFLVQTAGIVILTLVVNGSTTEALLRILHLADVSSDRLQDMQNAIKQLHRSKLRAVGMLKHDRFLADANWRIVDQYTIIHDPYVKRNVKPVVETVPSILSLRHDGMDNTTECHVCHTLVKNEPTVQQIVDMTEEARLRVIRALKVSFWHQFEHGVLSEVAVQMLVAVAETAADKKLTMVHHEDIRIFWQIRGVLKLMKSIFVRKTKIVQTKTPPPRIRFLRRFWKVVHRTWFDWIILLINLANMIIIVLELYIGQKGDLSPAQEDAFFSINICFAVIYLVEFIVKVLGHRQHYFKSVWNWIDLFVLLISVAEVGVRMSDTNETKSEIVRTTLTSLRLARILRMIRIPRYLIPISQQYVLGKVNNKLFLGYDIGLGFINAVMDVQKILPQMVNHPKILEKLQTNLEKERLATVREMGLLQKEHPGTVIAVKTRHASRAILNQMQQALFELKEDGLVDEKEYELLNQILEQNMKRLWTSPSSIPPSDPLQLFGNVPWITGDNTLLKYMRENAVQLSFGYEEQISAEGDKPNGIYILVSGMVKIRFVPNASYILDLTQHGRLPNVEIFSDMTFESEMSDFLLPGAVIGELGVLNGTNKTYTATCETSVVAYFISIEAMRHALATFVESHSSLESRMWRAVGLKLGRYILPIQPLHQAYHLEKIRNHLEKSTVALDDNFLEHTFPSYIADVILLQGKVKDYHSEEVFTAPCLLPGSCIQIKKVDNPVNPVLMYIAQDEFENVAGTESLSQPSLYERILVETVKSKGGTKNRHTLVVNKPSNKPTKDKEQQPKPTGILKSAEDAERKLSEKKERKLSISSGKGKRKSSVALGKGKRKTFPALMSAKAFLAARKSATHPSTS